MAEGCPESPSTPGAALAASRPLPGQLCGRVAGVGFVRTLPYVGRDEVMVVGLPAGTVQVRPYTVEWRRLFEEEKARITTAIGSAVLDIQHIGSTSVPGLAAKPIIDIGIAVTNFEDATSCVEPLIDLGYRYLGENGIPRRHYFIRGEPRLYNVHMNEIGSPDWIRTTRFRDYLIGHADVAAAYAELKQQLAQQYPSDLPSYHAGKDAFIQRVLRLAGS